MNPTQQQHDDTDGLKFTAYIAFAINDKEFSSPILNVYAPSILPYMATADPEIKASRVVSQPDIITTSGRSIQGEVAVKNYIEAVYFGLNTNREYPPDIRKGEQVLLLRIQNTDTYFWIPLGRDDNLRRCEKMKIRVSNDTAFQKELTDDNTYWMELDTLTNKHVCIQTTKSCGEAHAYTIKIDAVQSTVRICDDIGNEILLSSTTPNIRMVNSAGSFVDINGDRITSQNATGSTVDINEDNITSTTSGSSVVMSGGSVSINASAVTISAGSITISEADGSGINMGGGGVAMNGNRVNIDAGTMNVTAGSISCPWECHNH